MSQNIKILQNDSVQNERTLQSLDSSNCAQNIVPVKSCFNVWDGTIWCHSTEGGLKKDFSEKKCILSCLAACY